MKYIMRFWPLYLLTVISFAFVLMFGSEAITIMAENIPLPREHVIVIDAGHGGEDGGATSCSGVLESDINLAIALRLNDLCHLLGYETRMIRTTDISVYTEGTTLAAKKASDLRQRVRIINDTPNAILVSIHQNTFSDSRYSGAQVFYAPTKGSNELAVKMQSIFSMIDPHNTRKSKESKGVYLMNHIERIGVLIECGFLSNPEEDRKLQDKSYQKMLCCAIVSALSEYINA